MHHVPYLRIGVLLRGDKGGTGGVCFAGVVCGIERRGCMIRLAREREAVIVDALLYKQGEDE